MFQIMASCTHLDDCCYTRCLENRQLAHNETVALFPCDIGPNNTSPTPPASNTLSPLHYGDERF